MPIFSWGGKKLTGSDRLSDAIQASKCLSLVYDYWQKIRGDKLMPSRADFSPASIVVCLPNLVLIDVLRDPLDFRYRLIGTKVDYHSRHYHTGQRISEIPERANPNQVWKNLVAVSESKKPSGRMIPYVGPHKEFLETRQITLPMSSDGENVDMILLAIDYVNRNRHFTK